MEFLASYVVTYVGMQLLYRQGHDIDRHVSSGQSSVLQLEGPGSILKDSQI